MSDTKELYRSDKYRMFGPMMAEILAENASYTRSLLEELYGQSIDNHIHYVLTGELTERISESEDKVFPYYHAGVPLSKCLHSGCSKVKRFTGLYLATSQERHAES